MELRVDLRVHARFDRPRRGRPDASVRRARGQPAADSEHGRLAALRPVETAVAWQARDRARQRPDASADAPGLAAQPRDARRSRPSAAAAMCCATRRDAQRDPDRHRLGSAWRWRRADLLAAQGIAACAWCPCPRPTVFERRMPQYKCRCCRASCRASPSRPASPTAGTQVRRLDGAVVGIDTFGESAPAGGAVPAFRLYRRARGEANRCCELLRRVESSEGVHRTFRVEVMTIRVAINGYGRIGRNVLRALYEAEAHDGEISVVAINDLGDAKTNAHLTKYDTAHGKFPGHRRRRRRLHGRERRPDPVLAKRNPAELPWGELGVDVVLECTGFFTSKEKAGPPAGRREEGHHFRTRRQGRGCDHRLWRQPQVAQGRTHGHFQRILHDQLPGAAGQAAARQDRLWSVA